MALISCPQCGHQRDGTQSFCSNCGFDYRFADQPQGGGPESTAPSPAPKKQGGSALGGFLGLVVIAFLVWFIFLRGDSGSTGDGNGSGNDPGGGSETKNLTGEFIRWEPVDDARGYAYFSITNHGSATATAECTITVRNDFGNFGFDILAGEPVKAGETITGKIPIDVSEGSFLIDEGEVKDC